MKKINILILSAGRRVELLKSFRNAKQRLNLDGNIIAVDITDTAPALYFADKYYLVPKVNDENYIPRIIDICNNENIDIIIPTIDTELLKLSEYKVHIETYTKAKVLISSKEVIDICRDKNKSQQFFIENGFKVPKLISKIDIDNNKFEYPLFIKPKDGSSSINTFKIINRKELEFFSEYVKDALIQEFIIGDEYTIDVFCDFESNPITIVPRLRIATRGGEILKGRIIKDNIIIDEIKRLISILKPVGHITIQCMKTKEGIKYIEINPRFGGGAPMSIKVGADSCENIFRLLNGEKLDYNENYKDNVVFCRFDDCIEI